MKLRLLRGRVLIRPTGDCSGVASRLRSMGLTVPATLIDGPAPRRWRRKGTLGQGIVVAMGPPALDKKGREVKPGFAVGDEVLHIGQHESRWVMWEDEKLRTCSQEEVQAIC